METLTDNAPGSSPLTRGKPAWWAGAGWLGGRIPSHAGKTLLKEFVPTATWAHPPLTRGKQHARLDDSRQCRLIPAHAGKTPRGTPASRTQWAHPRSRGENSDDGTYTTPCSSSSPLTRGKRDHRPVFAAAHGLIPAHAGKTRPPARFRSSSRAHPRSRGENRLLIVYVPEGGGSSPLTRGKLDLRPIE